MAFEQHLLGLGEALREEGVAVGTSELMDGIAALEQIAWSEPSDFKGALAATLAKSPEDRQVFEVVFDRWLFRATEAQAIAQGVREDGTTAVDGESSDAGAAGDQDGEGEGQGSDEQELDLEALREAVMQAIRDGDESAMRDLARLAIAAFGQRGQASGVLGVDVQRIRRALGLRSEPGRPKERRHGR